MASPFGRYRPSPRKLPQHSFGATCVCVCVCVCVFSFHLSCRLCAPLKSLNRGGASSTHNSAPATSIHPHAATLLQSLEKSCHLNRKPQFDVGRILTLPRYTPRCCLHNVESNLGGALLGVRAAMRHGNRCPRNLGTWGINKRSHFSIWSSCKTQASDIKLSMQFILLSTRES